MGVLGVWEWGGIMMEGIPKGLAVHEGIRGAGKLRLVPMEG